MELFMGEGFRWGAAQELRDESDRLRFRLTGDAYSLGKRLHVTDLAGREAIYVRQVIPSLFPRYALEVYGKPAGELVKDRTFSRPQCVIESLGWTVEGNLAARDYRLEDAGTVLACSAPEGDRVRLTMEEGPRAMTALGVMLTINCIFAPQESRHRP